MLRQIKRTYRNNFVCFIFLFIALLGVFYWGDTNVHASAVKETPEQFKRELDKLVPLLQDKYGVPGVTIGIINNGEIAYNLSYGYANIKSRQTITSNTTFQAASISKSLTALGIMQLVQQGKLDLNQPIDHYLTRWHLPKSPFNHAGVTIQRLLSHTAGLGVHGYLGLANKLPSLEQSLSGEGLSPNPVTIETEPGTKVIYSGGGYTVLQLVIEEVTGMSFELYMQKYILDPLDMKDSSFQFSMVERQMATPYGYFNNEIPQYRFTEQAAAGLYTTTQDLMKFMIKGMRLGNTSAEAPTEFISNELIYIMQQPVLGESALGIFVKPLSTGKKLLYHTGDNRGWHSFYGYVPADLEGLVILTNSENGAELRGAIYNQWLKYLTGEKPKGHYNMTSQRNTYLLITAILALLLGSYLIFFVKKCLQWERRFITQHSRKRKVIVLIRTGCLLGIGLALYLNGYQWTLIPLYLGKKYIFILIMCWLGVALFVGLFPKTKKLKQLEATALITKSINKSNPN
jgi:D-alanyl-D-alanine carboxypeptidase